MNYRFFKRSGLFVLMLFLLKTNAFAEKTPAHFVQSINQLMHDYHIPGASVAVIEGGRVVWAQGFGYADLATKRKVNENTLFQAASITKTLTAAAVLKLLNEHHIPLDEPVNPYLKNWQIPQNKYTQQTPITFRMLLNHTAAISNPYPDGGYGPKNTLPTLLDIYKGLSPATNPPLTVTQAPGVTFQYCNGCYAVLQGAMENISGESYPVLMQNSILKPARMTMSRFDNNFFMADPSKIALPYTPELIPYENAPSRSPIYSTGLLWTTATDLAKYNIAITQALLKNNAVISQTSARELITPSVSPTHGLGFFIGDKNADEKTGGQYLFHSGANIGYLTLAIISKNGKQGAVILINVSPNWNAKDYPQFDFVKATLKDVSRYYHWM